MTRLMFFHNHGCGVSEMKIVKSTKNFTILRIYNLLLLFWQELRKLWQI